MFERLVISDSESSQPNRKWYFLFSSGGLFIVLVAALVISLFSVDISLDADEFDMVQLISPVEQPIAEPPPLEPNDEPKQHLEEEQTVSKVPAIRERPQRRVNMARVDESPRSVPKNVSTQSNLYKARLANRDFDLGDLDLDVGAPPPSRTGYSGSGSGSGAGSSGGKEASLSKNRESPPPPPPVRKAPPVKQLSKKRVTSLGVINGKATRLPKPQYSAAARAVHARGRVSVRVLIDESGHVVSANAVAGHPLLRNAAEVAARDARFLPTLLSGEPVKVSGVIVYNFLG